MLLLIRLGPADGGGGNCRMEFNKNRAAEPIGGPAAESASLLDAAVRKPRLARREAWGAYFCASARRESQVRASPCLGQPSLEAPGPGPPARRDGRRNPVARSCNDPRIQLGNGISVLVPGWSSMVLVDAVSPFTGKFKFPSLSLPETQTSPMTQNRPYGPSHLGMCQQNLNLKSCSGSGS